MIPTKYLLLLLLFVVIYELLNFNSRLNKVELQSKKAFLQNKTLEERTNDIVSAILSNRKEKDPKKSREQADTLSEKELEMYFKTKQVANQAIGEGFDKELNFIALGDYGYTDKDKPNSEQKKLGEFIVGHLTKTFLNYDFMLSVGDNFYPFGLESLEDKKATIIFEETFYMSRLGLNWYSILGNHDLIGNMSAALRLSEKFPLWKQTEPYYSQFTKVFPIGNSNLKAAFVFLHSEDLVCRDKNNFECYKNTQKSVRFDQIQTQIDWLDETFSIISKDLEIVWKIVIVHNAVFSAGIKHGDNEDLKELILPLLVKYQVDVVLSGHDHSVQYLRMNMKKEKLKEKDADQGFVDNHIIHDETEESEYEWNGNLDEQYCSVEEFFYLDLTKFGINKSQEPEYYKLLNALETKYSRESTIIQHEFLHQFVLGNGGIKHEEICPIKQLKSSGKLRYAHSVSGIGDIKIREDRLDVKLLSVDNKLLYSVRIFRNDRLVQE